MCHNNVIDKLTQKAILELYDSPSMTAVALQFLSYNTCWSLLLSCHPSISVNKFSWQHEANARPRHLSLTILRLHSSYLLGLAAKRADEAVW